MKHLGTMAQFQEMATILSIQKAQNGSMKAVYDDFWIEILGSNSFNLASVHKSLQFIIQDLNKSNITTVKKYQKYDNFKGEWKSIANLMDLELKILKYGNMFDWSTDRIGTILLKSLNRLEITKTRCEKEKHEAIRLIKELYILPQKQDASLSEITHIFSMKDFRELTKNSSRLTRAPSSLIDIPEEFVTCFKFAIEMFNLSMIQKKLAYDNKDDVQEQFKSRSPCQETNVAAECKKYCVWHQDIEQKLAKNNFMQIMKYGMPQRKLVLDYNDWEFEMAKALFGEENVHNIPNRIAPSPFIVFCYRRNQGYSGNDIGMHAPVCNDFFPTPSDIGMTMTKNLNDIIKVDKIHEDLFDYDSKDRLLNLKIDGKIWSETTLVLDTNDNTFPLAQTYPRELQPGSRAIQIQFHQSKEIANMIKDNNYDDDDTEPFSFEPGYEYYLDIHPYGQISTEEFKSMNKETRQCNLDSEVNDSGIFKIYSQTNCRYECHVKIAIKSCGCKPWDFIDKTEVRECDVFGRTCFFNTFESLTTSPDEKCRHCPKNCDFMKFKVVQSGQKKALYWSTEYFRIRDEKITGIDAFKDFLMDENKTLLDSGFMNMYNALSQSENTFKNLPIQKYENWIVVHLRFKKPEVNIISPKYSTFDMIGNFGGQFGLFEQVTGASFLGIINLIVIFIKLFLSIFKLSFDA